MSRHRNVFCQNTAMFLQSHTRLCLRHQPTCPIPGTKAFRYFVVVVGVSGLIFIFFRHDLFMLNALLYPRTNVVSVQFLSPHTHIMLSQFPKSRKFLSSCHNKPCLLFVSAICWGWLVLMTRQSLWVAALLNTKFSFKIQSDLPQGKCFREESCTKIGWGPEALPGSERGIKKYA